MTCVGRIKAKVRGGTKKDALLVLIVLLGLLDGWMMTAFDLSFEEGEAR